MPGNYLSVRNVSLRFRVYGVGGLSLKKQIISFGTGGRLARDANNHFVVEALNNVSFDLEEGDRLGIVGSNGSGKSTLLRVLAGIFRPQDGAVRSQGRLAAIIDPSVALDPQATGYENIQTRAILMGISGPDRVALTEHVSRVSELGDYLAMPVHTYSSGMIMRLNFALSIAVSPEILLMDEWLSVTDRSFRAKAESEMQKLVERSSILVLASHDLKLIERVCNRGLYLGEGAVRHIGPIAETLAAYREDVPAEET